MRSPKEMKIIQIDITNACPHRCSNCTRFCGHQNKPFFMDFETFKKAVDSLQDYKGIVGMIGGEPTLHPEFEKFALYMREKRTDGKVRHLRRPQKDILKYILDNMWHEDAKAGLWSSLNATYYKNFEVINDTFYTQLLNDHDNDVEHQALLMPRRELGIGDAEWIAKRDACWIQNTWSATITPKGAFFCEVAGSLDMLFNGPGGWKIEPGWWEREVEDFADQLHWCELCSGCLDVPKTMAKDEQDDVTPGMLERLIRIGSPKVKRGRYHVHNPATFDKSKYKTYTTDNEYMEQAGEKRTSNANRNIYPKDFLICNYENYNERIKTLSPKDWVIICIDESGGVKIKDYLSQLVINPGCLYIVNDDNMVFNVHAFSVRDIIKVGGDLSEDIFSYYPLDKVVAIQIEPTDDQMKENETKDAHGNIQNADMQHGKMVATPEPKQTTPQQECYEIEFIDEVIPDQEGENSTVEHTDVHSDNSIDLLSDKSRQELSLMLASLYRLFLCRDASKQEIDDNVQNILNRNTNTTEFICALTENEERKDLLYSSGLKPLEPLIPLENLLHMLRTLGTNNAALTFTSIEYLLFKGLSDVAVRLFMVLNDFSFPTETDRILMLSEKENYLHFAWLRHRARHERNSQIVPPYTSEYYLFYPHKRYDNEDQKLADFARHDSFLADVAIANFLANYDSIPVDEIFNTINNNCTLRHMPKKVTWKINEIVENIFNDKISEPENKLLPQFVFTAGFVFSGCSAVHDALSVCKGVCDVCRIFRTRDPNKGRDAIELTPVRSSPSFFDIYYRSFIEDKDPKSLLVKIILLHALSFSIRTDRFNDFDFSFCSLLNPISYDENIVLHYLSLWNNFILNIKFAHTYKSLHAFQKSTSNFISDYTQLSDNTRFRYLLINNGIFAHSAHQLVIFPENSIMLPTIRDPRDQYISQVRCWGEEAITVASFIRNTRSGLDAFRSHYSKLKDIYRFIPVSYENFVHNPTYRKMLFDKLALSESADNPWFSPMESAKRIGRRHTWPDTAAMAQIEAAFPELIDLTYLDNFDENFIHQI